MMWNISDWGEGVTDEIEDGGYQLYPSKEIANAKWKFEIK